MFPLLQLFFFFTIGFNHEYNIIDLNGLRAANYNVIVISKLNLCLSDQKATKINKDSFSWSYWVKCKSLSRHWDVWIKTLMKLNMNPRDKAWTGLAWRQRAHLPEQKEAPDGTGRDETRRGGEKRPRVAGERWRRSAVHLRLRFWASGTASSLSSSKVWG